MDNSHLDGNGAAHTNGEALNGHFDANHNSALLTDEAPSAVDAEAFSPSALIADMRNRYGIARAVDMLKKKGLTLTVDTGQGSRALDSELLLTHIPPDHPLWHTLGSTVEENFENGLLTREDIPILNAAVEEDIKISIDALSRETAFPAEQLEMLKAEIDRQTTAQENTQTVFGTKESEAKPTTVPEAEPPVTTPSAPTDETEQQPGRMSTTIIDDPESPVHAIVMEAVAAVADASIKDVRAEKSIEGIAARLAELDAIRTNAQEVITSKEDGIAHSLTAVTQDTIYNAIRKVKDTVGESGLTIAAQREAMARLAAEGGLRMISVDFANEADPHLNVGKVRDGILHFTNHPADGYVARRAPNALPSNEHLVAPVKGIPILRLQLSPTAQNEKQDSDTTPPLSTAPFDSEVTTFLADPSTLRLTTADSNTVFASFAAKSLGKETNESVKEVLERNGGSRQPVFTIQAHQVVDSQQITALHGPLMLPVESMGFTPEDAADLMKVARGEVTETSTFALVGKEVTAQFVQLVLNETGQSADESTRFDMLAARMVVAGSHVDIAVTPDVPAIARPEVNTREPMPRTSAVMPTATANRLTDTLTKLGARRISARLLAQEGDLQPGAGQGDYTLYKTTTTTSRFRGSRTVLTPTTYAAEIEAGIEESIGTDATNALYRSMGPGTDWALRVQLLAAGRVRGIIEANYLSRVDRVRQGYTGDQLEAERLLHARNILQVQALQAQSGAVNPELRSLDLFYPEDDTFKRELDFDLPLTKTAQADTDRDTAAATEIIPAPPAQRPRSRKKVFEKTRISYHTK